MNKTSLLFKRNFITVKNLSAIGKVQKFGSEGFIFDHTTLYMKPKIMVNGNEIPLSTALLSLKDKDTLTHAILYQKNVKIDFTVELFGFPWNGDVFEPIYARKVSLFEE